MEEKGRGKVATRVPMELSQNAVVRRQTAIWALLLVAVALSCVSIHRAVYSVQFRISLEDSEEYSLERVLRDASMPDKTVILTTLNEAWAAPNSVIDLFLDSFRFGVHTRLLNHLVIVSLDKKAFSRCLVVHSHCFALFTDGVDFSQEAYFMTPDYLTMMWRRIDFLRSVLEMGYNFVFTA